MWGPAFAAARRKYDEEGRDLNKCQCKCYCKKPSMTSMDGMPLCDRCAKDQQMFNDGAVWWD